MAIDTPARLAILGAGPIGLEAALYARFLGYDVVVYERGDVAARVRQSGQTQMATSFKFCRTTLGLTAVQAQDEAYRPPVDDALLTYQEWIDAYLVPLSQTDLLSDHLRLHTTVLKVEKAGLSSVDLSEQEDEENALSLRVVSRDAAAEEQAELFDGVLDCTGLELAAPNGVNPQTCGGLASQEYRSDRRFHVLGSKSRGEPSDFSLAAGYQQIRDVFTIIGDRATLDLYSSATRLIR